MKELKLEDKFAKIRIHLLWDRDNQGHAYYGIILVKMKIIEKNEIPTFETEGRDICFKRADAEGESR